MWRVARSTGFSHVDSSASCRTGKLVFGRERMCDRPRVLRIIHEPVSNFAFAGLLG